MILTGELNDVGSAVRVNIQIVIEEDWNYRCYNAI